MPRKPKRTEGPTVAEEEWNFEDSNKLPDSEVDVCLVYEYARERLEHSAEWRKAKTKFERRQMLRERHRDRKLAYLDLLNVGFRVTKDGRWAFLRSSASSLAAQPFPDTPWQLLELKEKRELVEHYNQQKKLFRPFTEVIALTITLLRDLPEYAAAGANDFDSWMILHKCWHGENDQLEHGFFGINWNYPDGALKAKFAAFLSEKRGGRKAVTSRQGKVKSRQHLKALGAKRLLDAGFTVPQAMTHSAKFLHNEQGNPRPLYHAPRSWYDSKNKVVPFVLTSLFGGSVNNPNTTA